MTASSASSPNTSVPLPQSDDLACYTMTSVLEISHHLRRLANAQQMVTVYANHGRSFILTQLIEVDTRQRLLFFSPGSDPAMNEQILSSERCVFVCAPEGVKTQFSVGRVREIQHKGRPTLVSDLPKELIKLQRREYFRIRTPQINPITCVIHDYDNGNGITLPVHDLSLGGVALTSKSLHKGFEQTVVFSDVSLDLKRSGTVPVELQIRNILRIELSHGGHYFRIGCEFKNLSQRGQNIIQRYVAQLERERRALVID